MLIISYIQSVILYTEQKEKRNQGHSIEPVHICQLLFHLEPITMPTSYYKHLYPATGEDRLPCFTSSVISTLLHLTTS